MLLYNFVHIPRTGGTSLWFALLKAFPRVTVRGRPWDQVKICAFGHRMKEPSAPIGYGLVRDELESYLNAVRENPFLRIIGGHVPYGIHKDLGDVRYATILRNPVDRVISLYSMIRSRPIFFHDSDNSTALGDKIAHHWSELYDMNLSEMMEQREFRLSNDQSRMVTGGSADHEEAIFLLKNNYVFGLTEHMDDFDASFSECLGVDLSIEIHNLLEKEVNPRKRKVERYAPTAAEISLITEANQEDIKVYEWAKSQVLANV